MPLFSIGVPTYNRAALLRHTLESIRRQSFDDFEVLVGNDYTQDALSAEALGIRDARFRFLNHSRNLGEIANMNVLLREARGRYFTWQFDDDFYATNFLAMVHEHIVAARQPSAVFSSFDTYYGLGEPRFAARQPSARASVLPGDKFVTSVFAGRRKTMGACGVYDRDYLVSIGGAQDISGEAVGLYSEHVLLLRAGLLDRVAYIAAPLVSYRDQDTSWSGRNVNVELYLRTGLRLIEELIQLVRQGHYRDQLGELLLGVLAMTMDNIVSRMIARDGRLDTVALSHYLAAIESVARTLEDDDAYYVATAAIARVRSRSWAAALTKGWIKRIPRWAQALLRGFRARLS